MIRLTAKQCEALQMLEETNGRPGEAARKIGIRMQSIKNRINAIHNNTGLDPLSATDRQKLLKQIEDQKEARKAAVEKKHCVRCTRPCAYRAADFAIHTCDYISIAGERRGCPPGDACTRFEPGERKKLIMDEWRVPKVPEEEELYEVQLYAKAQRRLSYDYRAKNHL